MRGGVGGFLPFFPVHDLAATRDFYGRDLGLALVRETPDLLVFATNGTRVGFRLTEQGLPRHPELRLGFECPDVQAVYKRLRLLGVETEGAPRHDPGLGAYGFLARDPDGYRVLLFGSPAVGGARAERDERPAGG